MSNINDFARYCVRPTVTVIIPAYNAAAFVAEAIESVLRQSYSNFELIVIDDGSTDDTASVVATFRDDRLRLVQHANQGLSQSLNRGIDLSRGEIIAFLDADDVWLPHKLERELAVFDNEEEVGLVFSDFVRFDECGINTQSQFTFYTGLQALPTRAAKVGSARIVTNDAFVSFIGLGEFPAYHSAIAVRRTVLGTTRFMDVRKDERGVIVFLEDLAFFPRIFARTHVAFLSDTLMHMRRHENNSTIFYNSLYVAKLNSLRSLRDEPLTCDQTFALRQRIATAAVAAGRQRMRERKLLEAGSHLVFAATRGKWRSVLISLLRASLDIWRGETSIPGTPGSKP